LGAFGDWQLIHTENMLMTSAVVKANQELQQKHNRRLANPAAACEYDFAPEVSWPAGANYRQKGGTS
jgi:hypothetical protein